MFCRDYVVNCGRVFGDKVAYIDGERRRTWREVADRSLRLATGLQALGIRKGDTIAILAFDHIEVVEHLFAAMHIGAVRVGLNRGYSPHEIAHVVKDSNAKLVIAQDSLRAALEGVTAEVLGLEDDVETLIASNSPSPQRPPLADDDPAVISYTSGTTGLPKGVIMTQGGIRQQLMHMVINCGFRHEDVYLNPTAMSWATFMLGIMSIVNGMTTVLGNTGFDAERFLRACGTDRVTSTIVVPVMMQRILDRYRQSPNAYDLTSLRQVTYGSSPASAELLRAFMATFRVELVQLYGLTELCAWATYLHHADHERGIIGSCGKPAPHCEVSIRDPEGNEVSSGEKGELWIRSDTTMKGYQNLPELTASVLADGWLKTHDIGYQDEEGYIYLTDRKHFLIITGAANVFPSIVETTLASHPAVREVAVVGAPHPEWGEAVVAMVALNDDATTTAAALIDHCRGKLAKWEVPKLVEIVPALPRGPTQKISKNEIRDRYRNEPQRLPWRS